MPLGDYIADFACKSPRIVIECDGGQHADSAYDQERDAWFKARGYKVFRFWNGEVIDNPDGVLSLILQGLGRL